MNDSTVKVHLYSTSMNPLPVLACQFFKMNYLHTSKNTLFKRVHLILKVKSDIIINVMNIDEKIIF